MRTRQVRLAERICWIRFRGISRLPFGQVRNSLHIMYWCLNREAILLMRKTSGELSMMWPWTSVDKVSLVSETSCATNIVEPAKLHSLPYLRHETSSANCVVVCVSQVFDSSTRLKTEYGGGKNYTSVLIEHIMEIILSETPCDTFGRLWDEGRRVGTWRRWRARDVIADKGILCSLVANGKRRQDECKGINIHMWCRLRDASGV